MDLRKVFLEDFIHYKSGRLKGTIDWTNSINRNIRFQYDNKIENFILLSDGKNNKQLVKIYYNGKEYETYRHSILNASCFSIIKKERRNKPYEIGKLINCNNVFIKILDVDTTTKGNTKYKYKCLKCGNIDWTSNDTISRNIKNEGKGHCCNFCSGRKVIEGKNDIPTTTPWMIPYFQGGYNEAKKYSHSSSKKINPICPNCKKIHNKQVRISNIYSKHGFSCCYCSDGISYPNKFMAAVLYQADISFESEYSPEFVKKYKYRYDFYVPQLKLIIEMDGGLGHGKKTFSGEKDTKQVDHFKDELANKQGLDVIRINSDISEMYFLKKNIIEKLDNILNLKNIDWDKCNKYATSSLVKEVCKYYNFTNQKPKDVAKKFHISHPTAITYLKRGNEIGLCDYSNIKFKMNNKCACKKEIQ